MAAETIGAQSAVATCMRVYNSGTCRAARLVGGLLLYTEGVGFHVPTGIGLSYAPSSPRCETKKKNLVFQHVK